ncbi:MAG: ribonuclease P protein component [Pikeienuella sp.]
MPPAPLAFPTPKSVPTLKKRKEFLAAARARKWATASMVVQARQRRPDERIDETGFRVGYTCSKKVGGAVVRNRAKRRLRAVATHTLPRLGRNGWDYVLIGKSGSTVSRPFSALIADLEAALDRLHAPRKQNSGGKSSKISKEQAKPSHQQAERRGQQ